MKNHWNHQGELDENEVVKIINSKEMPTDLTDRIMNQIGVNKKRMKKERTIIKRKAKITSAIVAATAIMVVGSGFISPTMADSLQQIPLMKSIFKYAGDLGLKTASDNNLVDKPNLTVSTDNSTFIVPELVYDGTRLSLGIERSNSSNQDENAERFINTVENVDIKINGQDLQSYAPQNNDNSITLFYYPGITTNSMIMEFSDLHNQGGTKFPSKFDLTVSLKVKGSDDPIVFNLPVTESQEGSRVLEVNETKDTNSNKLTLKSVKLTPITTNISTQLTVPKAYDPIKDHIEYEVLDTKGNKIKLLTANAWYERGGKEVVTDIRLEPINDKVDKIVIKPYHNKLTNDGTGRFQYDQNGDQIKEYLEELTFYVDIK